MWYINRVSSAMSSRVTGAGDGEPGEYARRSPPWPAGVAGRGASGIVDRRPHSPSTLSRSSTSPTADLATPVSEMVTNVETARPLAIDGLEQSVDATRASRWNLYPSGQAAVARTAARRRNSSRARGGVGRARASSRAHRLRELVSQARMRSLTSSALDSMSQCPAAIPSHRPPVSSTISSHFAEWNMKGFLSP
jgi:hypothetical protein